MVDIDTLQIKHRDILDLTNKAIADLKELGDSKALIVEEIASLKGQFNALNNQIAEEKLAWLQQKTAEQTNIDSQKQKIEEILSREAVLNELQEKLEGEKISNQELLNSSNKSLEEAGREKVAAQAILDTAKSKEENDTSVMRQSEKRIESFKEAIKAFHGKLVSDLEEM